MITVEQNPAGIKADYLAGLNRCFDHWGGDERFDWACTRAFDGQAPDLLVVRDEGTLVAGSAVNYRTVRFGKAEPKRVGIMTGSWTLPEARRRGHFERLIEGSQRCAAECGAAWLLAFVTAQNPSYRRLVAAGAVQWETHYLSVPAQRFALQTNTLPRVESVAEERIVIEQILERVENVSPGAARFVYHSDDWGAQYLRRPNRTELLSLNGDGSAVIQMQEGIDSVLYLSSPQDADVMACLSALNLRAVEREHALMFFTASAQQGKEAVTLGMKRLPGYLMALPAKSHGLTIENPGGWDVQSGDRM